MNQCCCIWTMWLCLATQWRGAFATQSGLSATAWSWVEAQAVEVPALPHQRGARYVCWGSRNRSNKTATIQQWPVPRSVKEVRSFIGLVSYYRRFVEGFALIARWRPCSWWRITGSSSEAFDELKHIHARKATTPWIPMPVTLVSGLCSPKWQRWWCSWSSSRSTCAVAM